MWAFFYEKDPPKRVCYYCFFVCIGYGAGASRWACMPQQTYLMLHLQGFRSISWTPLHTGGFTMLILYIVHKKTTSCCFICDFHVRMSSFFRLICICRRVTTVTSIKKACWLSRLTGRCHGRFKQKHHHPVSSSYRFIRKEVGLCLPHITLAQIKITVSELGFFKMHSQPKQNE